MQQNFDLTFLTRNYLFKFSLNVFFEWISRIQRENFYTETRTALIKDLLRNLFCLIKRLMVQIVISYVLIISCRQ